MTLPRAAQNFVNLLRFVGCSDEQVKLALWEAMTTQGAWL